MISSIMMPMIMSSVQSYAMRQGIAMANGVAPSSISGFTFIERPTIAIDVSNCGSVGRYDAGRPKIPKSVFEEAIDAFNAI